jgi:hypothetical protein
MKNAEGGSHGILNVLSQQWASLTEKNREKNPSR